jgi:hypothetical protein
MTAAETVVRGALAVAAINGLAGLYGVVRWYRVEPSRAFWVGLRAGQIGAIALAVGVGILWLDGRRASADLFYLYALLPLAIGLVAEQLRILAAEQVLAARGLADAQAVGELEEADQQSVVLAILRREMGVMAAAGLVVCFLALRAAGTAHGF